MQSLKETAPDFHKNINGQEIIDNAKAQRWHVTRATPLMQLPSPCEISELKAWDPNTLCDTKKLEEFRGEAAFIKATIPQELTCNIRSKNVNENCQ